ncbi:ATP-grasp fold amidoligase family protein [Vibrio campbellii]|uniref:ATP-grasp fold amidoligase family protein n=1 Tax=Vibrio campbellii TaxID=680 RepID=UPI0009A4CA11|nr:ATP-grasp fold amidoligase family protein [Vibrio campbellii]OPH51550.1 hypothetical protein B4U81_13940 [Vibrio campbellii]
MPSIQYRLFSNLVTLIPLKARLKLLYFRRFKRLPNLSEPETFNEKIQLKKLIDRDPLLTISADKLASKEYVQSIVPGLYIPKTIWSGECVSDLNSLNFDSLPENYVYKANHTSQTIEIIRSANHLTLNKMKRLAKQWLEHDQSGSLGEWAYSNIPPKIFIEEFLDFEGEVPDDYKFFVYNGSVKFIQLDSSRFTNHKRNMFDHNWNDLGFDYSYPRKEPAPKRPEFLDEMIKYAEKLGERFDFVRVDFYFYKGKVTFGELTIYPGAGFEKFPSKKWDLEFGKYWDI